MVLNKKLLAQKRKQLQAKVEEQAKKKQIAEASNVHIEGISSSATHKRKALVEKKLQFKLPPKTEKQQQQKEEEKEDDETLSVTVADATSTTTNKNMVNRLATLLSAPADGSAFMALSKQVSNEEKSLSSAKKMSAKRRTRLEIAQMDNDDENDNADDDDDDDEEETQRTKFIKNKKIVDIVDNEDKVGPIAPAQRKELQNKKKNQFGGDDELDEGDDSDEEKSKQEKAGMKLLKNAVQNQNHKKILPHQERPDYEFRLRRVATSGCVRLFNALAQAQSAGVKAQTEAEKTMTQEKAENHKIVASREAFMSALRGAASSSRVAAH